MQQPGVLACVKQCTSPWRAMGLTHQAVGAALLGLQSWFVGITADGACVIYLVLAYHCGDLG
jgi:hypothetical protein